MQSPVVIVFSHLRWGFVFQRPQHLLSRLAGRWHVLFVEEPIATEGPARLQARAVSPHLTVLVPHTPVAAPGFHDDQIATLQPLLSSYLRQHALQPDVAWLYTPMALPLVDTVAPACVVYDCMDELSAFRHAPRQLAQRESALMRRASLVLTGGPSLYEARRGMHRNLHCLPSAVDAAHFAPGSLIAGSEHDDGAAALLDALPRPRLGYFGVVDERLDIELIAQVADAHPEWTLSMVGPVVKIDPASLPQRPNIRWLGMQPYERLPYLLSRWDLCLMPFALNEATRFISPTKTLEYMAGEKPVVSTAVHDVIALYGEAVAVAPDRAGFIEACAEVLAETGAQRCARASAMLNLVSMYSWNRSADTVHRLMAEALEAARSRRDRAAARALQGRGSAAIEPALSAPAVPVALPAAQQPAAAGGLRAAGA